MIDLSVTEIESLTGTAGACRAVGASRASWYRRRRPPRVREHRPRPAPARALSGPERATVTEQLNSERFMDSNPAQVWATLLDEGTYLCSERTMYRILAADDQVRERREQRIHPAYARPVLLAEQPNEVWSWDITKLLGPAKWSYHYLYVIVDVFSRYVVGWTVQARETGPIAEQLIAQTLEKQQIARGQLTIHADRGTSMTSKPVAFLLADLGVTKSHNRPYSSPIQRRTQDPEVPARLTPPGYLDRARPRLRPPVLRLVQRPPSPLRDRAADPRDRAPRPRPGDPRRPRPGARRGLPRWSPTSALTRRSNSPERRRHAAAGSQSADPPQHAGRWSKPHGPRCFNPARCTRSMSARRAGAVTAERSSRPPGNSPCCSGAS